MVSKKILIVDDETGPRTMLEDFTDFAGLDLEVTTAASAKEALVISAQNRYNWGIVFLDGLYGRCFPVADMIKHMNPETKIILWSTDNKVYEQMPNPNFDGELNKPTHLKEYVNFLKSFYNSNGSQDNPQE